MLPIDTPVQLPAQALGAQWSVLPSWIPVADMGVLPVNAFVRGGAAPLLVDTGLAALGDAFIDSLGKVLDPASLRWIWLSHTDPDHTGNLARVLEWAPRAEVLTSFLGMAKLGLGGFDTARVRLLEPGVPFELGRQRLLPLRPPYYDAPESLGFYDEDADVLFAVDSFGALLPDLVDSADRLEPECVHAGMTAWSAIDAPWLAELDDAVRSRSLDAVARLDPALILSGHLPPARAMAGQLADCVARASRAPRADALSMTDVLASVDKAPGAA
jgi:glyoxylase-like metal-dependent hydrolase (beta-lactamase superfamily II)